MSGNLHEDLHSCSRSSVDEPAGSQAVQGDSWLQYITAGDDCLHVYDQESKYRHGPILGGNEVRAVV